MIVRYPIALCALAAWALLPSGCGLESSKAARHSISRPAVIEVPVGATLPAAAPGPAPVINEEIVDMSLG
jgi:hypothetical protein